MTAPEILVIILSIFLALFLLAGIILLVLMIMVTVQIRRVTTKAENAANNFESAMKDVSSASSKLMFIRMATKGFKAIYAKKGGKK